jgi:hypothetical protein
LFSAREDMGDFLMPGVEQMPRRRVCALLIIDEYARHLGAR